jgi:enoyl-CoA hydratase
MASGSRSQIAVIAMDRPDRGNAIDPAMARRLHQAILEAIEEPAVMALVVTGAGRAFSPGADANFTLDLAQKAAEGSHPPEPFGGLLSGMQAAAIALHRSPKLTLAAINGSAAAGALDMALACDIRITSRQAKFAESYVRLALPPLNGGAWLLTRAVGEAMALRLLLSGEVIDAEKALDIGIVHEVVDEGAVLERVTELAESLTSAAPSVAAFIKQEVRDARSSDFASAQSRAFIAGMSALNSAGFREAVDAALARHRR